ncbi:MAG TPA: ABC transporter substrate-binding protein [Rhizobiaceae bacterium]|nr:ABC transporter substrate-binding protein [Rhizobiaceae bacterium]
MKRASFAALSAAFFLMASAGTFAQDAAITIAVPEEPAGVDFCNSDTTAPSRILRGNVGEGLTRRNVETGVVEPLLATDWRQEAPGVWDFTLREGVTFHDGSALNAEAAAKSINRIFSDKVNCSIRAQLFGANKAIAEATGPQALRITMSAPDPILPLRLSSLPISAPSTPEDGVTDQPVGTGPYRMASWQRGAQIVLEQYADYWGDKPDVAKATYLFRPEGAVRVGMVDTREADVATNVALDLLGGDGVLAYDLPNTIIMRLDMQDAPLSDIRVRRAIGHAIDRQGMIDGFLNGAGEPAAQIISRFVDGYNPDLKVPEFDPALAADLIKQATADGVDTKAEMTYYVLGSANPYNPLIAQAMAEQLNAIGLNVKVVSLERAAMGDILLSKGNNRRAILQYGHDNLLGDASLTVNAIFPSSQKRSQIGPEFAAMIDPAVEKANAAVGEERTRLYRELIEYWTNEVIQDVYFATLQGAMKVRPGISYEPNFQTNEIMLLSDFSVE